VGRRVGEEGSGARDLAVKPEYPRPKVRRVKPKELWCEAQLSLNNTMKGKDQYFRDASTRRAVLGWCDSKTTGTSRRGSGSMPAGGSGATSAKKKKKGCETNKRGGGGESKECGKATQTDLLLLKKRKCASSRKGRVRRFAAKKKDRSCCCVKDQKRGRDG